METIRSIYHYLLAWLGSAWYRHPSCQLFVVGITGTKGKSTVIELINAILESAGKKTALMSSVRIKIGEENNLNLTGMTMPGRFFIQRFLNKALNGGCEYALIEVTSQGVLQHRHKFIDFDAAIINNLEPEHIEVHGSFKNYRTSKVKFFSDVAFNSQKRKKKFFINTDTRDYQYFADAVKSRGDTVFFNRKDLNKVKIKTKLIGEFNRENIAAATTFARSVGIDWETIKSAIESFDGVPGRLEFAQKVPFSVIIDYAHTPDSLEKVYKVFKKPASSKNKSSKMICVLGSAGGGRDVWKRPVMGEIAARYCDKIFLTNEDPFNEDPKEILDEIEAGIISPNKKKVKKLLNRKEAIRTAIKTAKKGDVIIITGKGSEPYMRVSGGKKIPWNEREIVLKILNHERIEI